MAVVVIIIVGCNSMQLPLNFGKDWQFELRGKLMVRVKMEAGCTTFRLTTSEHNLRLSRDI